MEKITFVVPVYNAEATLTRTIDSILYQTDDRWRILIINDGSKDGTDRIGRQYAQKYPDKIIYYEQENRGLGGARNQGMSMVETEYVSFLDSDDWLMPEYVERINRQLEVANVNRPELIMTLPQIYHEGSKAVCNWYDKERFEQLFEADGAIINPQIRTEIYQFEVNQCRKVCQVEFLRRIHFQFEEKLKWEDVYPHFYLLSKCTTCMGIGSTGFYYRIGAAGQITASRGEDRLDFLIVMKQLLDYIKQENRTDLEFPVMRVCVRFAIWGIRMADTDTRKHLVRELNRLFRAIPRSYYRALKKGTKHSYSKADARQYRLFMFAIRYRIASMIFNDYFYQDMAEKTIKRVLKAKPRVA